jgi:DNA primase
MSVIDDVKQKIDIVEVIGQYATLTKSGRTFRALCPFHSEKNPSFFVYPEQQSWHCFGACNTGGDVFSFVMKKENIDFGEALRLLAQRAGVTIPSRYEQGVKKDERERLYQANEAAAQYFHNLLLNSPAGEKARNYLASRGLSPKTISDFQLGFSLNSWEALKPYLMERGYTEKELLEAGLIAETEEKKTHDRFRNHLMFPIKDARGRTTGFGARVLDDSLPKYINSPQTPIFDKSGTLYGINLAAPAIRQQNIAVIVEGYMDVITAHQNGFTNVIASMGTAVTDKQVTALKRLARNVNMVLALDADAAGEEAMLRCVDYENTLDAEVKVLIMPSGKDPDDVIKEEAQNWQHLLDEAIPVIDYAIQTVCARLDMSKAKDQSAAVSTLLPLIARARDVIRQGHYVSKLSDATGTDLTMLKAALNDFILTSKTSKSTSKKEEPYRGGTFTANLIEEQCLALLLQHPELKSPDYIGVGLLPEYFENSENREIFLAWQQVQDPASLKGNLDVALWEHLDSLISKKILATQIEERYNRYVLRLREEYLRGLERKRAAALTLEAEMGGTAAELAKLEEQGIEASTGLKEVFTQKARRGREDSQNHPRTAM